MSDSNQNIPSASQDGCVESVEGVKSDASGSISENESVEGTKQTAATPSASKIAKPTGLKLPAAGAPTQTRIGRLCNNIPKPAIPPNPAPNGTGVGGGTMSTVSSIRKISDELARKKLTDVDEIDENTIPFFGGGKWAYDRKMSSGSVLSDSSRKSDELRKKRSSDASISADSFSEYWKSDFEPRRASDASVVLTEDTDQFIIGDRVWVGGLKPGQIAYIGETQFAPGEWAGVVLDEPIGKNDGTVANIRYFQCEPKKGIFSRLTRLTRYPLVEGGAGEPSPQRPVPIESRKSNGSLLASVPKKSSLVLTPSTGLKNSTSKPPSPDSALHPNISVGDRVIVKSSQGSKAGILRYLGTTDFAAGEWCGVELDDPLGKNDGSVSGTRYFECRPKFGLFAPLHKVSKSPANKRLSQPCAIHKGNTSGIRRQGSKESLASISSTASTAASVRSTTRKIGVRTPTTPTSAKNALQETLKEKELHIEQLLKERDLERAEVTRAASQADEAERQLAALKQEFEQHKEEAEARVSDLDAMVCLLKSENEELANQLEDEKKKSEDLQFRFEEESIEKADIKLMSIKYEEKMKMLENTLFEERKRTEALEQDSNKLFEAEEQMVFLKDEMDGIKEELAQHKKVRSSLEQERISLEAHLTSARAEIESLKLESESLRSSASQDQNNLKDNLVKAVQGLEENKKELDKKQTELEQLVKTLETTQKEFEEKEREIHTKYLKIINELTEKHKTEVGNQVQSFENLKNDSESKLKLLESQLEKKIKQCSDLDTKLNEANILLSKNAAEKSVEQNKQKELEERLHVELKSVGEKLQEKEKLLFEETVKCEAITKDREKLTMELLEVKKLLTSASESTDKQVTALNEMLSKHKADLENINIKLEDKTKECDAVKNALTDFKKQAEEKTQEMEKTVLSKNSEIDKLKEDLEKTKKEFDMKSEEIKNLYESHEESFKVKIKNLEDLETERKKELESLTRDLESTKNSLETRDEQLRAEQANIQSLAGKLNALEENYKKVSEEKDQLQLEAGDAARKLQGVEEKLAQAMAQKAKLENDISNFINTSNDSSAQLTKLNEDLRGKEKELDGLREELSKKTQNFERTEQELRQVLEKQEAELTATKANSEKEKENFVREVENLKNKLEAAATVLQEAELDWKKKTESISVDSETQVKNLEEKIRAFEKKEIEDKIKHEEKVKQLTANEENIKSSFIKLEQDSKEARFALEKQIQELGSERNDLLQKIESLKAEFSANQTKLSKQVQEDAEMHANESEKLRNELKETTEKLTTTLEELTKNKEEKNKANEEKLKLETTTIAMEELLKQTQVKNTELEMKVFSVESENKILKDTINQMREEKCHMDKDSTDKMMLVTELRSQLEALENSKKTCDKENDTKIKSLEKEVLELNEKFEKVSIVHSTEKTEKEKEVQILKTELEKIKLESSQLVSGKEKDIENASVAFTQLKNELEKNKLENEKKNEFISQLQKSVSEIKEQLEIEKKKSEENSTKLEAAKLEKENLRKEFEVQAKQLAEAAELKQKLAEACGKLSEEDKRKQEAENISKQERDALEKVIEATRRMLSQRENEVKTLSKEVELLNQEKVCLLNNNRVVVENLEKEKTELQKKIQEIKQNSEIVQGNANTGDSSLQEEREFAKGQVDFLNSVIVDMQKKNDALKARIEILEMGFSPEDVDEFNLHNINTRSVAPRLFCDICDRFDLHDTEDCPTQAMEEVPPSKSSKSKVPPPERPYCDICEVFGHDTADCDDAETF